MDGDQAEGEDAAVFTASAERGPVEVPNGSPSAVDPVRSSTAVRVDRDTPPPNSRYVTADDPVASRRTARERVLPVGDTPTPT